MNMTKARVQYTDRENGCADCGAINTGVLLWFGVWAGLRSCTISDEHGKRKSVEPFWKKERGLCLTCFRAAVAAEKRTSIRFH